MLSHSDNDHQEILKKLPVYLKGRVPDFQIELIEKFAQRYYLSASTEDLLAYSLKNLFGALLSQWNFIYQRKPGEAKVRVFNPTLDEDGWESTHTIIQASQDDIPFLVDSIRMEANREGFQIYFSIHLGGLNVLRDAQYGIVTILPIGANDSSHATTEAPIYMEIDRQTDLMVMEKLRENIERVLSDVRVSVADWPQMAERARELLVELEKNPPPLDKSEISESKDFLQWMINNHFTFLGARDYKLTGSEKDRALSVISGTGLGVLRDDGSTVISRNYADLPPQARKLALSKNILIIAKTNTKATVHRETYTDYIGVKRFNKKGELIGERRFVGLFTSTAYHSSPQHIPFLRRKVTRIVDELHYPRDSHHGKEVVHILETLPRDDLFQATHEELMQLTLGILHLQERRIIRLFIRKDAYNRYYSCLVYVPRDIFTSELCNSMQDILMRELQGIESSFTTYFSESILARIHFIIRVNPKQFVEYNGAILEQKIISAARSWSDELRTYLINAWGEAEGLKYYAKYHRAFPASYTEYYLPATAIDDIKKIEALAPGNPLEMIFYKAGTTALRLKLFHTEHTIALSDVLPTLENMGLRLIGERLHEIVFRDGSMVWISDFDLTYAKNKEIDVENIKTIFQEAFTHIWLQEAEDDGFNRLVLEAQLSWRETAVLRAYTKYLRQTGFTFSQNYVEQALINNAEITKDLIRLFILRFSPDHRTDTTQLVVKIEKSFDTVVSLDEDRILRRLLEIILATLRTNYFQTTATGQPKLHFSFKFDPAAISELPLPRPLYEIFVYSPRVEAVHLRAGKVARGGIRWSDRREDFRTEVLGLMKAQQVKNSVIVPMGAKGGFFPKQLPLDSDRDTIMKEVIACYSTFMRGLLDITDNIKHGKVVIPPQMVRYDDDDPYLVVAADKGTATFSDIANSISREYEFWLEDAFASGGSAGYDHKKMGITARGAWESVKRHFRELDLHADNADFTVVGIGDMSGDVFGNGMLMSKHIKLIGAFDHRHIFVDPNPDPIVGYDERTRLFHLPRSSWMDYSPRLISKGGGVFDRSAKSIKISPELKRILDIKKDSLVPNDLIRALLKTPVDLLWNGGIGTFVKASEESHADVGDRTNDGIRVEGNELKARVVVEGGNLGLTQLARIEYSLKGGIIYTDFIDNSAGVDCSDHEVNIKILLNKIVADSKMTVKQRNKLLEKMTDEVAQLVLRDNYEQTQMLSLEASVASQTIDLFRRYMTELEKQGRLNRQLQYLPDQKTILERKKNNQGLTRPEIAVLLAYSKMFLKQDILATNLPEDSYFIKHLAMAFPTVLQKKYLAYMEQHSLRREIIATQLSKNITDHMGINFVERLQRETGAPLTAVMRAYIVAGNIYDTDDLWHQIELLDTQVSIMVQQKMMLQIYYLVRRATRWFLNNQKLDMQIKKLLTDFGKPIKELIKKLPDVLTDLDREQLANEVKYYTDKNVPLALATPIANCNILFTSLDIVEEARKHHFRIVDMAVVYYELGWRLELNMLREQLNAYPMESQWEELARSGFRDDLDRVQRKLSSSVLYFNFKKNRSKSIAERIALWLAQHQHQIERFGNLVAEIKSGNAVGFVTYSVVLRELFVFAKI